MVAGGGNGEKGRGGWDCTGVAPGGLRGDGRSSLWTVVAVACICTRDKMTWNYPHTLCQHPLSGVELVR